MNELNPLFYARISEAAYDDEIDENKFMGFKPIFIDAGGTQVHILRRGSNVIIAFRGTSEKIDFIKDLKFWRNKKGTHTGFYEAFSKVNVQINEVLRQWKAENLFITITGHSLGGSLALICASNLPWRTSIVSVVTFGAAKPGGKRFKRRYGLLSKLTHNFVNGADFVPRSLVFFTMPGNPVLIDGGKEIHKPSSWKMFRCFVFAWPGKRATDHLIDNYIEELTTIYLQ